jgi:hypothetical protein
MSRGRISGWNAKACPDLLPFPPFPCETNADPAAGIRADFPFVAAFSRPKAGFHFAGKCSKTSAATVNQCGSGLPEGNRPATFRQRAARGGKTRSCREPFSAIGASPSGKAGDFDSPMRRFESSRPSHPVRISENFLFRHEKSPPIADFLRKAILYRDRFGRDATEIRQHSPTVR